MTAIAPAPAPAVGSAAAPRRRVGRETWTALAFCVPSLFGFMDTAMQRVLSFGAGPESFTQANAEVNGLFRQG